MTWDDVYLDQACLRVRRAKTNPAVRTVWLDGETTETLRQWRRRQVAERLAGLPEVKLHSQRQLRVHVLISTGEDVAVIAKMIGYANSRVTEQIYGEPLPAKGQDVTRERDQAIASALDGLIEDARKATEGDDEQPSD